MSEIIGNTINGAFLLFSIFLTFRLNKKVNKVTDQVINGHKKPDGTPINLREEQDERHIENQDVLKEIKDEIIKLRESVSRIWQKLDKHTDEIHDLENTQTKVRK